MIKIKYLMGGTSIREGEVVGKVSYNTFDTVYTSTINRADLIDNNGALYYTREDVISRPDVWELESVTVLDTVVLV